MMTIEQLEKKVEVLIDKIRNLHYPFSDKSLETEADRAKEDAIASLEALYDLAQTDSESDTEALEEEED